VKVTFEGQVRDLDLAHVSLRHAVAVQEFTGLSVFAWQQRLTGVDAVDFIGSPEAAQVLAADPAGTLRRAPMYTDPAWIMSVAAAHWLMLAQSGEDVPPLDDDYNCDVLGFYSAFMTTVTEEAVKAKAVQDQPGPTVSPARRTPSSRPTGTRKRAPAALPPGPLPRTGS